MMADTTTGRVLIMRLLVVLLVILVVFIKLVPVQLFTQSILWPDVLLLSAVALIIRRAVYLPYWLVGSMFLFTDFMLSYPLGLGAFVALIGTEAVRRNRTSIREMIFAMEWFTVSVLMAAMCLLTKFIMSITLAEGRPFSDIFAQVGISILLYPIIVLAVCLVFRVSKPVSGAVNERGHAL